MSRLGNVICVGSRIYTKETPKARHRIYFSSPCVSSTVTKMIDGFMRPSPPYTVIASYDPAAATSIELTEESATKRLFRSYDFDNESFVDDSMVNTLYTFYRSGGVVHYLVERTLHHMLHLFSASVTTVAIILVDWAGMSKLDQPVSLTQFLIPPRWGVLSVLSAIYFVVVSLWCCFEMLVTIRTALRLNTVRAQLKRMGVLNAQRLPWEVLLEKIEKLDSVSSADLQESCVGHRDRTLPVDIESPTAGSASVSDEFRSFSFDMAVRLTRRQNFLTLMVHRDVLKIRVFGVHLMNDYVERVLELTIMNNLFHRHTVNPEFLQSTKIFVSSCKIVGVLSVLAAPVLLLRTLSHFVYSYAEDIYSNSQLLGPMRWSRYSVHLFTHYNELPHLVEKRLRGSRKPAEKFINSFRHRHLSNVAKFVTFICGSLAWFLLVCVLVDDEVPLHLHIADRNVVWWMALITPLLSTFRGLVDRDRDLDIDPRKQLDEVVLSTRHYPTTWLDLDIYDVYRAFTRLYCSRLETLGRDVLTIAVMPWVLFFKLPHRAEEIITCIARNITTDKNLGTVVKQSLFDRRDPESEKRDPNKLERSIVMYREQLTSSTREAQVCHGTRAPTSVARDTSDY